MCHAVLFLGGGAEHGVGCSKCLLAFTWNSRGPFVEVSWGGSVLSGARKTADQFLGTSQPRGTSDNVPDAVEDSRSFLLGKIAPARPLSGWRGAEPWRGVPGVRVFAAGLALAGASIFVRRLSGLAVHIV